MGLREGLLCLLAEADSHGYELKLTLESTTADAWQVNVGQVYTTLQRLERDGLVTITDTTSDGRVIYSLTPDGRAAAEAWIEMPVALAAAGRDEITLKILMAIRSDLGHPRRVIERQRGSTMGLLQDYTTLKSNSDNDEIGWLLHLDRLIFSAEAELRWLDRVEARLEDLPSRARTAGVRKSVEVTP